MLRTPTNKKPQLARVPAVTSEVEPSPDAPTTTAEVDIHKESKTQDQLLDAGDLGDPSQDPSLEQVHGAGATEADESLVWDQESIQFPTASTSRSFSPRGRSQANNQPFSLAAFAPSHDATLLNLQLVRHQLTSNFEAQSEFESAMTEEVDQLKKDNQALVDENARIDTELRAMRQKHQDVVRRQQDLQDQAEARERDAKQTEADLQKLISDLQLQISNLTVAQNFQNRNPAPGGSQQQQQQQQPQSQPVLPGQLPQQQQPPPGPSGGGGASNNPSNNNPPPPGGPPGGPANLAGLLAQNAPIGNAANVKRKEKEPMTLSTSKAGDWRLWRRNFEAVVALNGWGQDIAKIHIPMAMRDDAAKATEHVVLTPGMTLTEALDAYARIFVSPSGQDLARVKFQQARRQKGETAQMWHTRVLGLYLEGHPEDTEHETSVRLKDAFILGIENARISDRVRTSPDFRNCNYYRLLEMTQDVEASILMLNKYYPNSRNAQLNALDGDLSVNAFQGACWHCGEFGHVAAECLHNPNRGTKSANNGGRGRGRGRGSSRGRGRGSGSNPSKGRGRGSSRGRGRGAGRGSSTRSSVNNLELEKEEQEEEDEADEAYEESGFDDDDHEENY